MSSCGEGEVSYLLMLFLLFWGGLPLSEVRVEALHKRGGGGVDTRSSCSKAVQQQERKASCSCRHACRKEYAFD